MKKADVDELEKLIGQLSSIHTEISALSKKSPNDAVNSFKIKFINTILLNCNQLLGKTYKPLAEFDVFDIDDVPSNSDVTFIVAQYAEALEKYRADNISADSFGRWHYIVDNSQMKIITSKPGKLNK